MYETTILVAVCLASATFIAAAVAVTVLLARTLAFIKEITVIAKGPKGDQGPAGPEGMKGDPGSPCDVCLNHPPYRDSDAEPGTSPYIGRPETTSGQFPDGRMVE